ncbi:WD40 repeat domain-containing protein [Streptomyces sp. NBC_00648]|uniref:WD40 repeat domain-containing protein n=1 Tax=Streptomyces sp. NBC_00648 TaxID=2975797 RepID=UPI00324F89FE
MDVTALTTLVAVPSALLGLATAYYQFRRARSETRRAPAPPRRRGGLSGVTVDMATAARPGALFGREDEIARLRAWTGGADRQRLVGLLGPAGIGKSRLASEIAEAAAERRAGAYDYVVWRSLKDGPAPATTLAQLLTLLSRGRQAATGQAEDDLAQLAALLGRARVLLVLDNVESVLDGTTTAGHYLAGFEGYRQLMDLFLTAARPCTLVLTGRELPEHVHLAATRDGRVKVLRLAGLSEAAAGALVGQYDLHGSPAELRGLCHSLSGNPLKLQLAASAAAETYGGDIAAFLVSYEQAPGDLGALVRAQVERISPLEQHLLDWLTVERTALTVPELTALAPDRHAAREVSGAVTSLYRRSLVERTDAGQFVLQPAVSEYLTDSLVERCVAELLAVEPRVLDTVALFDPDAPDHLQSAQIRYLLQAVLDRYRTAATVEPAVMLHRTHTQLHDRTLRATSCLAGNLINLAAAEGVELGGWTFAGSTVRRADFTRARVAGADFRGARLVGCRLHTPVSSIHAIAFSPDGLLVAFGGSTGDIWISRVSDLAEVGRLRGHVDWIRALAFHPDGRLLASAADDGTIRIWDHRTGREVARCTGHEGKVTGVVFDAGHEQLLSVGDDGFVVAWSTRTWRERARVRAHDCQVWALARSADGDLIATAGEEHSVRLWHAGTLEPHSVLTGHSDWVLSLAFTEPPLRLISGGHDGTVRVWNLETGAVDVEVGHGAWVWAVAARGSRIAAGYGDGTLCSWLSGQDSPAVRRTLLGHTQRVWSLGFSGSDGLLASGGDDETLRLWDASSGECVRSLHGSTSQLCALHARAKEVVTGGADGVLRVWRRHEGGAAPEPEAELVGHTGRVWSLRVVGADRIVSGGEDGTVRLWLRTDDHWQGRVVADLNKQIWSVEALDGGRRIAVVTENGSVSLLDMADGGRVERELAGHSGWVWSVAATPDGSRVATASYDRTVGWWDTASGRLLGRFTGHASPVTGVCVSEPLGRVLTGAYNGEVRLWDTADLSCRAVFASSHSGPVWNAATSPSGRLAATAGGDEVVVLWDLEAEEPRCRLSGHHGWVLRVAFCDDDTLASGDQYGNVRLWDTGTGHCVSTFHAPRVYERLDLRGVRGLSARQLEALSALGATVG